MPVWAHGSIELFALIIIGIELALKLRWIGWLTMLKHKRTMLKVKSVLICLYFVIVIVQNKLLVQLRITYNIMVVFHNTNAKKKDENINEKKIRSLTTTDCFRLHF